MISIPDLYNLYCKCSYKVTTDSRTASGGEIFFALSGENFDGNAYVATALCKGVAFAVVNEDSPYFQDSTDPRIIKVASPFETLRELSKYHRTKLGIPVIGLTGTNGKTTTKELLAAVLSRKFNVCATKGNLNNDIGVPLSLLQMTPETQIAVIEMGASHPGDIARLVELSQPTHGLITNVGKAHLQGFGSFEGVKATKGELYDFLSSRRGSQIFLNQDDSVLVSMAQSRPCHVFGYGLKYQRVSLLSTSSSEPFVGLCFADGTSLRSHLVGSYNASNILAALCVGEFFGVSRADALDAIANYTPTNNRSQMQQSGSNTLIVDAYNANPSSMAVALDNLFAMNGDAKYALLGDMRELGSDSLAEHIAIVRRLLAQNSSEPSLESADSHCEAPSTKPGNNAVRFYLVGEEFRRAILACNIEGLQYSTTPSQYSTTPSKSDRQVLQTTPGTIVPINQAIAKSSPFCGWYPNSEALTLELSMHPIQNGIILIKGSRGIQMERVLAAV